MVRERFADFVAARGGVLWRSAWLLTGDPDRAEQLLATALARTWSAGRDAEASGGPEERALTELVRAFLSRRGAAVTAGSGPVPAAVPGWPADDELAGARRDELLAGLALLTPRQRVVLVLLHAERREGSEAAALLGWTVAAVEAEHVEAATVLRRRTRLLVNPDRSVLEQGSAQSVDSGARVPDADETYWLRLRLADDVPEPPYAPHRAADAERRGRRRRHRFVLAGAAVALVLAAVVGVAVLAGPDDPTDRDLAADAPERVLVDAPVPARCLASSDITGRPELPLDLDLAPAVWLRFCPAVEPAEVPGSLGFAPAVTVSGGVEALVARWVQQPDRLSCPYQRPGSDGTARMQLGTADGALHVVDLVVGPCGEVTIDGVLVSRDGRTVFADAVDALGRQVAREVRPASSRSGAVCPQQPMAPASADRTTTPDYPQIVGIELPLPTVEGLVCRYERRARVSPQLVEQFVVSPAQADQIRAAYLARLPTPAACSPARAAWCPEATCVRDRALSLYAVVLTDRTGSRRSFGLDTGACNAVVGPGAEMGWAGQWLVEAVRDAEPAADG